jgi:hypothetical protein
MDSSQLLGIVFGGTLISALGGVAEYMREKEMPSYKSLVRDFFIGAVLVIFLLQIMPESMSTIFAFLPSMKNIVEVVPTSMSGDAGPDIQLGPARF